MTNRPTIISIMSSIVYCGAKLGNLLTGVDLNNLGIFNRFQHVFGFRDQNTSSNQINIPRLFSMNNNQPTPITRFQGLQNQYQNINQFNNALEETYNSLTQVPINVLIDTVASSIVVSNNGQLTFNQPALGMYRSIVCLASWMLTGVSPITTNVAITLLGPAGSNVLNTSILKIASLIEPYRNMWLCQAATSIFEKVAEVTLRIIPQSFINFFNPVPQQEPEQATFSENEQSPQDLPIQISSHQHTQFYINMFDQEIAQLQQMVDLLLKIQIQSSLSLQTQRGPNQDFYNSSFSQILRNGTVQEKIKLIVDNFSKFLSLLLKIQSSANKFDLNFPLLEAMVLRNKNSIVSQDSKYNEQNRQIGVIEQKINQINQRIDIINQFPPTQSPNIDQLTKLLQDFIQAQIQQFLNQVDQAISQMKTAYDDQFNNLNQQQLEQRQTVIDLGNQFQQLKEQLLSQINSIDINYINQTISKTINQSMTTVESQINTVWTSINGLNFFFSQKYSKNDLLINSCIDQYNQMKQDLQQNVYSKSDIDNITTELYQRILTQVYQQMPDYLGQQYHLNPSDIDDIKRQLSNLPQPSQVSDQAFYDLKTQFENCRDNITAQYTDSRAQIQLLQQQNNILNETLGQHQVLIDQQQEQIVQLQHDLSLQQDSNRTLSQQITQILQDQDQQLQNYNNLNQRVQLLAQKTDQLSLEQHSLSERTNQLNQQIQQVRTQQQQDLQSTQTLIQRLSQTVSNKLDITQFEQMIQNLVTLDQFNTRAREQEARLNQLQESNQQCETDINHINTFIEHLQVQINELSNQVIKKDLFNEFQQQVNEEFLNIQNQIQEIQDTALRINHIQLEIDQLEHQINQISQDYDPLQIYNLKSQLQSLKEISYKRFDQLDYLTNITQVNRILDFNHSAAIKSY